MRLSLDFHCRIVGTTDLLIRGLEPADIFSKLLQVRSSTLILFSHCLSSPEKRAIVN